jgi:hypothetical protein
LEELCTSEKKCWKEKRYFDTFVNEHSNNFPRTKFKSNKHSSFDILPGKYLKMLIKELKGENKADKLTNS